MGHVEGERAGHAGSGGANDGAAVRAFLGLGSNLGDRRRYLAEAVASLSGVVGVSPVYETEPVGGPGGQGSYLNLVVELDTTLTPRELLGVCHRLEAAAGRVREERWGPRTLDVDVLLVDDLRLDDPDLQVPHPRMYERNFVMAPLADLAPDVVARDWRQRADGRVEKLGPL
jgi:2-amino-4-hydroxy-6-hydroxymethyldihydropteridine diphosphokinase